LGFTATPNRADGAGLESVFDRIIYRKDLRWGIENKYLSPLYCKRVNVGYDLSGVAVRMGDYSPADLERVVNVDKCNDAIAEVVKNIAELPCIIFAVDVKHAEAIAARIPGAVALSAASKDRA
jgi:superfamily II DNA or RNA helicase